MMRRRYQEGGLASLSDDDDEAAQTQSGSDDYPATLDDAESTGDEPSGALSMAAVDGLDMPGAAQALRTLMKSSAQARAALQQAREKIQARKYSKGLALLAVSSALGAPTRSGSTAESFSNMAKALQEPIREKQAFEETQAKDLLGIDTQLAGLDERAANAQLQLAMVRARLANQSANAPNDLVLMPDGSVERRTRSAARVPGTKAYVPQPKGPTPSYDHYVKDLPNGMKQTMRFNRLTGTEEPLGDPYTPAVRLTGNAALQARGKLQTTAILRDNLNELREKWFGYTVDKNGVKHLGLEGEGTKHPGIQNTLAAGKYQGFKWIPSEKGEGFDKAVDTMRGTIRQLTRVPGEGSMSDWEGKIDQAKLPSRTDYESVTEDTFDRLDQLLNGYENTTRSMLGLDTAPSGASPPAAPAAAPAGATGPVQPRPPAPSAQPPAAPSAAKVGPKPGAPDNPDDYAIAVAPASELEKLKANPTSRMKAFFIHTFGYLPPEYPWDHATRGEYVKMYKELPDGYE